MLRFFARWWMRRRYIFKEECESALADLQADLAARRAGEKRALIVQLKKEADAIEKRIAEVAAMEKKGFSQCEERHEVPLPTPPAFIEKTIVVRLAEKPPKSLRASR